MADPNGVLESLWQRINARIVNMANDAARDYVDERAAGIMAEAKALIETRATVKQVTAPPTRYEPGVLYVIPED